MVHDLSYELSDASSCLYTLFSDRNYADQLRLGRSSYILAIGRPS